MNLTPLINGKSYSYTDITVNVMGVPLVGITGINYGDKQDIKNIYGAGGQPVSRGYGNIEPFASITLLMEEVENIMAVAPGGNLRNIPEFDIPVIYADAQNVIRKHVIRNVRFMNNVRDTKQGDTSIPVELELITSEIVWQ